MSITHKQARELIQLNMDQVLSVEESAILSTHLRGCSDCAAYANEVKEVANMLSPMMKKKWNIQPIPLSISALSGKNEKRQSSALLTMRTTAVTLVVMALFFSAWQFVLSSPSPASQLYSAVPPVPTPSSPTAAFISTQLTGEGCAILLYMVQEDDTLASIAEQFLTSEDTIMEFNKLETKRISPAMELGIPICNFTTTGTFHSATFTSTYTPISKPAISTPSGRY